MRAGWASVCVRAGGVARAEPGRKGAGPRREGWLGRGAGRSGGSGPRERGVSWARGRWAGPSELGRGESGPGERVGPAGWAGLGKKVWAGSWVFGLLWVWVLGFSFLFSFLFLVLIQTKLFEFKQNLNSTPMHSNKIKPCTSMNATKFKPMINFNH